VLCINAMKAITGYWSRSIDLTEQNISDDDRLLKRLNPEQKRAVLTTEGPLLILAGAGSGKTRVVTRRVAWLISKKGVHPGRILAITFTNKAAAEMKDRIEKLIGLESRASWIGTFHAMMLRILRRHADLLGYRSGFSIFDSYDQKRVMAEVLKILGISERLMTPTDALRRISHFKNNDMSPEDVDKTAATGAYGQQWSKIYRAYQKSLMEKNAMDFDDILTETLKLFRKHPEVLQYYSERFLYILVDEYQDTNKVQYELIHLLSSRHQNLCVVGDDDQSIYAFRGATIRNILDFEKDFPDCTVVRLEQNYRSTKTILAAANQVIADNRGRKCKTLWTAQEEGVPIQIYRAADHTEEARYIARGIQRRFQLAEEGEKPEIAVLYRMNALSRNVEFALRELGIDYRIYGGTRFYERSEIKDVTAYLALIQSSDDDIAFRRVVNQPRRGIGSVTLERLAEFAGENALSLFQAARRANEIPGLERASGRLLLFVKMIDGLRRDLQQETTSFPLFVKRVEEETGLVAYFEELKAKGDQEAESRLQNLVELISDAIDFENRLASESLDDLWEYDEGEAEEHLTDRSATGLLRLFLERAALYSDQDKDSDDPAVSLMTIHNAKGLEFDTVFLVGAEEDIFPSIRAHEEPYGIEEERRLAYVAVTRAKKELLITAAVSRLLFGHTQYNALSRFVEAIPDDLTEKTGQFGPAFRNSYDDDFFNQLGRRPLFGRQGVKEPQKEPAYQAVTRKQIEATRKEKKVLLDVDRLNNGDIVHHVSFGPGVIKGITKTGDDAILVIDFDGTTKRFLASQAVLSPDAS